MIWEGGITLSDKERAMLQKSEASQDRKIVKLFMSRPDRGFTFHDIVQATGFNQDSTKRSISNMAGSGDLDKYKDKMERFPLVKTAQKKLNPETGVRITCYKWNSRYNKPPSNAELVALQKKNGQMNFNEM